MKVSESFRFGQIKKLEMYFGLQKEGMEQKLKQYLQQLMKMFLEMECLTKTGPHSV